MAPAGSALPAGVEIIDNSVFAIWIDAGWYLVQSKCRARAPGDIVIGTGGIAAYTKPSDDPFFVVKRQTAAKCDYAPDGLSHQRVTGTSKCRRVSRISGCLVDRVGGLQAEQGSARLDRRIEVSGRKSHMGNAGPVCRTGLSAATRRLPGHWASGVGPLKAMAQTAPSRATTAAHSWVSKPPFPGPPLALTFALRALSSLPWSTGHAACAQAFCST